MFFCSISYTLVLIRHYEVKDEGQRRPDCGPGPGTYVAKRQSGNGIARDA